jgi:hypothetical protein
MCTTSVECKTIIIAVLMVKSGMDPHMISGDFGWFGKILGGQDHMFLFRGGHANYEELQSTL